MEILTAVSIAFGIVGTICAIIFGFATFRRNNKNDDNNEGRQTGTMLSELGYIKSGVDDIKRKQESQDNFNITVMAGIQQAKDSAASAHKRIDTIEDRLNH